MIRTIPVFLLLFFLVLSCNEKRTVQYPDQLLGLNIQYRYSNDREYNVKLEKEGLSYRYISGSKPEKWWGKFPYNYSMLEDGQHVVAWHEEGYDDYITLIIDFERNTLFGSGIIKCEEVHFAPAEIFTYSFE